MSEPRRWEAWEIADEVQRHTMLSHTEFVQTTAYDQLAKRCETAEEAERFYRSEWENACERASYAREERAELDNCVGEWKKLALKLKAELLREMKRHSDECDMHAETNQMLVKVLKDARDTRDRYKQALELIANNEGTYGHGSLSDIAREALKHADK